MLAGISFSRQQGTFGIKLLLHLLHLQHLLLQASLEIVVLSLNLAESMNLLAHVHERFRRLSKPRLRVREQVPDVVRRRRLRRLEMLLKFRGDG